jgi:hypothetical protein
MYPGKAKSHFAFPFFVGNCAQAVKVVKYKRSGGILNEDK